MSLDSAPVGGEGVTAPITVVTPASDTASYSTPRDAMKDVLAFRRKNAESQAAPAASPQESEAVEQPQELAEEANAAPQEIEATGEPQEIDPVVEPPLDLPRSWSKDAAERWTKLDRDTQQFLLDRDRADSVAVRNAQNEAAEQRKALETEKSAVAQARQQYEAALPALLQTLQEQQAGEFSDIKTMADVERLAREDWPRYSIWSAHRLKIDAVNQEVQAAQQRQQTEFQEKWTTFALKEDQLLLDKVPELADQEKAGKLRESAVSALRENFKDQELGDLWNGKASLSLRDHRVQLLIMKAVKYDEAQKAAKQAVAKPIAPVQRPGVAPQKGEAQQEIIQNLNQRLDRTGSMKDAAALVAAKRSARR